jgi:nucleotide-binding universal stress UspA family protein
MPAAIVEAVGRLPASWPKEQEMSGITVGIDGSHNSHRALDWAVQEAATRHSGLTVLTVHQVIASWATGNPVTVPGDKALQEKERLAVEEATEKALKDAEPARPASVQVRSIMGFAAEELIEASKDSDLLVIGARGGGGFHRLTLGSISSQVAHHAHCPVVVVPGPER